MFYYICFSLVAFEGGDKQGGEREETLKGIIKCIYIYNYKGFILKQFVCVMWHLWMYGFQSSYKLDCTLYKQNNTCDEISIILSK